MKRYTIDVGDRRFTVDVQDVGQDEFRVMVGDRWYNARISQGREIGQDWDIVELQQVAPVQPIINISMPEQPAPVIPAPVFKVSMPDNHKLSDVIEKLTGILRQQPDTLPQILNAIRQIPAPVVNVAPAAVNMTMPELNIKAASVATVERDYTGKITKIKSNAEAISGGEG